MYVEPSLHSSDKSHLIVVYDSCNMLLNSVCQYLAKNFCISILQGYWSTVFFFFFLVVSLSDFGVRVMLTFENKFGSSPSPFFLSFWMNLRRIDINSLNVW